MIFVVCQGSQTSIAVIRSGSEPTPPPKKHKRSSAAAPADREDQPSKRARVASPSLPPPPANGQPSRQGRDAESEKAASDRALENGHRNGRGIDRRERSDRQHRKSPNEAVEGSRGEDRKAERSHGEGHEGEGRSHRSRDEREREEIPREKHSSKIAMVADVDEDDRWDGGEPERAPEQRSTRSEGHRRRD